MNSPVGYSESRVPARTGDTQLSLRDIVYTLFRRKWIILVIALPIIAIGGFSLFSQTGAFTASAKVVVELMKVDLPRWNTSGRNLDYDRELSTLFNIAMSVPVGDMAAMSLEDSIPVIKELDPRLVEMEGVQDLRGYLLEGLSVSVIGESAILEFQFTSGDPRISLMAVGALRDAFIDYQVHGRKNTNAVGYYDEQIQTVRTNIDSLLAIRSQVHKESGYSSLKDELRNEVGQLADIEGQLFETITARRTLQVQYDTLKKFLDGDPRDFPVGIDESKSHTLVYWRNMVSRHEDNYYDILSVHTEDSIPAKRHRLLLTGALERLKQEENAYVESVWVAMVTLEGKEVALKEQAAELRERNSRGPAVEQQVSILDVEINSMSGLLKDLQTKRGEVRLSQLADERVSSVVALTDPEMSVILSGGKTMVYFLMIVIFGLALGIVAALVMEAMDHRVYTPRDVEEHLELPVFASVTRKD